MTIETAITRAARKANPNKILQDAIDALGNPLQDAIDALGNPLQDAIDAMDKTKSPVIGTGEFRFWARVQSSRKANDTIAFGQAMREYGNGYGRALERGACKSSARWCGKLAFIRSYKGAA